MKRSSWCPFLVCPLCFLQLSMTHLSTYSFPNIGCYAVIMPEEFDFYLEAKNNADALLKISKLLIIEFVKSLKVTLTSEIMLGF